MKKRLSWISLVLFCFFSLVFSGLAGEKIELEAARRAAEYHGELIFEKDLKVCDHELMLWPSGEEAVYVFTLMAEADKYPDDVFKSDTALQGAYLALSGQFDEGYDLLAQPDHYMTVVVGATTDMPSFLKAHAGLPEHLLYLRLMENPPYDPYFIYVDLFHTCVGSKWDQGYPHAQVREIHLEKTIPLSDLSIEKTGVIPEDALDHEWGLFLNPGQMQEPAVLPDFMDFGGVKDGKHLLNVKEYAKARFVGCSPAAFVNCLKYLEGQGKVKTKGKSIRELLEWTAICYRTDPANGGTTPSWIVTGSKLMFMGLGYKPNVAAVIRQDNKPGLFLTQFANEINAKYPVNLGGSGKGIFQGHSTTGIGYWKQGSHIRLIIHDGWAGNNPVYVKYSGYPAADCEYPKYMRKFHTYGATKYPEANPEIKATDLVLWDKANSRWQWEYTLKSKNAVKAEIYKVQFELFNSAGNKYKTYPAKREKPYYKSAKVTLTRPEHKRGEVRCRYFLVDDNGHLLEAKKTVRVEDIIGKWQMNFKWKDTGGEGGGTTTWTVKKDGTFDCSYGYTGTWNLNKNHVVFKYQGGQKTIYSGTINNKYSYMSGTMKTTIGIIGTGTWNASRKSDGLSPESQDENPKTSEFSPAAVIKKE